MLKQRTTSAGFFSQSGTIKQLFFIKIIQYLYHFKLLKQLKNI